MTTFADRHYDFEFSDGDDPEHLYEIFEVKTGKVIAFADDEYEAQEKVLKLEDQFKNRGEGFNE